MPRRPRRRCQRCRSNNQRSLRQGPLPPSLRLLPRRSCASPRRPRRLLRRRRRLLPRPNRRPLPLHRQRQRRRRSHAVRLITASRSDACRALRQPSWRPLKHTKKQSQKRVSARSLSLLLFVFDFLILSLSDGPSSPRILLSSAFLVFFPLAKGHSVVLFSFASTLTASPSSFSVLLSKKRRSFFRQFFSSQMTTSYPCFFWPFRCCFFGSFRPRSLPWLNSTSLNYHSDRSLLFVRF